MRMPTPMKPPGPQGAPSPRGVRPHLRLQKIHLTGKSAFPAGGGAFAQGADGGPPPPGAAFPAGDGGAGAAPGDTGQ